MHELLASSILGRALPFLSRSLLNNRREPLPLKRKLQEAAPEDELHTDKEIAQL